MNSEPFYNAISCPKCGNRSLWDSDANGWKCNECGHVEPPLTPQELSDWLTDTIKRHPEWAAYRDPVDIQKCREALGRLIHSRARFSIPAQPDDDDMLISRALDELERMREHA